MRGTRLEPTRWLPAWCLTFPRQAGPTGRCRPHLGGRAAPTLGPVEFFFRLGRGPGPGRHSGPAGKRAPVQPQVPPGWLAVATRVLDYPNLTCLTMPLPGPKIQPACFWKKVGPSAATCAAAKVLVSRTHAHIQIWPLANSNTLLRFPLDLEDFEPTQS